MNKLIIDNRTDLSDHEVIQIIQEVIKIGRISNKNKQYCLGIVVELEGIKYAVNSYKNKNSDRFLIFETNYKT